MMRRCSCNARAAAPRRGAAAIALRGIGARCGRVRSCMCPSVALRRCTLRCSAAPAPLLLPIHRKCRLRSTHAADAHMLHIGAVRLPPRGRDGRAQQRRSSRHRRIWRPPPRRQPRACSSSAAAAVRQARFGRGRCCGSRHQAASRANPPAASHQHRRRVCALAGEFKLAAGRVQEARECDGIGPALGISLAARGGRGVDAPLAQPCPASREGSVWELVAAADAAIAVAPCVRVRGQQVAAAPAQHRHRALVLKYLLLH